MKVSYDRDQVNTSLEWSLIGHGDSVIITMKRLQKQQAGWNRGIGYRPLLDRYMSDRGFFVAMQLEKAASDRLSGCSKPS